MKILFLASDISQFGGIQLYNRTLLSAMREYEQEVELIQLKNASPASKIEFTLKLFWAALSKKPSILFCSHIGFAPLCYILYMFFGIPYVMALYGIDVSAQKTSLEKRAIRAAKSIILIFEWAKNVFHDQFPDLDKKVFFLPSPVDGTRFIIKEKPARLLLRHGLENNKIIISVARLSMEELNLGNKGYDRVLKALPEVIKKIPDVRYVLIGGGDGGERVKEMIRELDLENHVILAGAVSNEDLVDYYNMGDVFVLPSKFEGFAIVFMEALICGRPVIAGQYSEKELLGGALGISVDPDNISAIAQAMTAILTGKESEKFKDRESLRAQALALFGLDVFKGRVKKLLELMERE